MQSKLQGSVKALTTLNISDAIVNNRHNSHENSEDDVNELTPQQMDDFTKEFIRNRIEMTPFQKVFLAAGSSIAALVDPRRSVYICIC